MTALDQSAVWEQRSCSANVETILQSFYHPCPFQKEFAEYLDGLGRSMSLQRHIKVCEMGSEFGVTSLLLSHELFERHALDVNARPLELLTLAAARLRQHVGVHTADMFRTEWSEETFDIVFSNGVLEHYDFKERVAAMREFARVTRRGGFVVVGVPNHYSTPYRCAYLLRRACGCWPYPLENKIADLSGEMAQVPTLAPKRTLFFDEETIFAILPRSRITAPVFRLMHRWAKFEPYLRVFEMVRL